MNINVETERLLLNPIAPSDSLFMLDLLNTEGWLTYIGDRKVRNERDAKQYIDQLLQKKHFFYHVIKLKGTNQPIGVVSFIVRASQLYPDIGFALLPAFAKKGYAYEATVAYLTAVKESKSFEKILGITLPHNQPSIELLEKIGLQFQEKFIENGVELALYSRSFAD